MSRPFISSATWKTLLFSELELSVQCVWEGGFRYSVKFLFGSGHEGKCIGGPQSDTPFEPCFLLCSAEGFGDKSSWKLP